MEDPAVRPAGPADLAALPALEARADELFTQIGLGPLPPPTSDLNELARARALLVVGEPVIGFARLEEVDGSAHLEQISVEPDHARRGLGTALLEAALAWARAHGYDAMTLCTFADVPWNAPFYRRHGFEEVSDPGPGLRALRATENRLGLEDLGRRVVMRRTLTSAPTADDATAVVDDVTARLHAALGNGADRGRLRGVRR